MRDPRLSDQFQAVVDARAQEIRTERARVELEADRRARIAAAGAEALGALLADAAPDPLTTPGPDQRDQNEGDAQ